MVKHSFEHVQFWYSCGLPRFTAQDAVLIFLFSAIATLSPSHDVWEIGMIATLGLLQLAESKLPWVQTLSGKVVWILLKLTVAYLLIGYTGGVASSYYLMLLLPIVTAATSLNVFATLLFSLLACGAYLSFLLFIDWTRSFIEPDQVRVIALRLLFLAIAGNLVNALAQALREQAQQLSEANRHLSDAQAAMRRSERLAALGQLSAGLAHEIRNPLGTIKASAEMLTKYVPSANPLAQEMAGFISTEVDRTNSLVTRFLDFARPLSPQREIVDLSTVIDRAIAAVKRETQSVLIQRDFPTDLEPFALDPNLIQQVFYNLTLNAAQASPEGATVTMKVKGLSEGVEVSVADRGTGIPAANQETIFNPFFTTKPTGVGLGLPIVQKIIDEHGGSLTVESEEGQGSTFRVYLPYQTGQ